MGLSALFGALAGVGIDPVRESTHRQLMQLYWLTGRRTMALRQYETCRQLLQEELGIEPLAVTQDLYHRIRDEEPPPDEPGTLSFPPPVSPLRRFVGREPELTLLRNCFAEAPSGRGRLVLVAGEAGIGKTRLLQEFARQVENRAGLICWGNCFPGEQGLPYQPLIEALRSAVRQLDPTRLEELPAIWLHEVTRLVPELAEHTPPLPAVPPLPPEQEKNRLYESIAQFLIHATAQSPISNLRSPTFNCCCFSTTCSGQMRQPFNFWGFSSAAPHEPAPCSSAPIALRTSWRITHWFAWNGR